jgi:tripartite-type tricarboxylate transporter receptor subunit TctC
MNLKSMLRTGLLALATAALTLGAGAASAQAQGYPNRPIKIICSFPPGGGTDFLARLVGQKLSERWGQPVIVDNRPGANGIIGARAGMSAEPDGYTLYVGSSDQLVMGPPLFENLPYDPLKDFVPVTSIANQHVILVVNPALPAKTTKEFVALAKAQPGKYNFSSSGTGTVTHLAGELFQSMAGVKLTHVPYKGSAPAIADLLSGQDIQLSFAAMASIVPQIKAGKVRPLLITATKRTSVLPDVPTAGEEGYAEFIIYSWNGVFVPVGTPREIVVRLSTEINSILKTPEVMERLASVGVEPTGGTPEQFAASFKADSERWAKIIKDAGIEKTKL